METLFPTHSHKNLLQDSSTLSEFLVLYFNYIKNNNPKLSLRELAKKLGYKNPSFISDVLNNKKKANKKLLSSVLNHIDFDHSETRYLNNLFKIEIKENVLSAKNEITVIRKYWSVCTRIPDSISSISIIISTILGHYKGGLTKAEVFEKYGFFITKDEISNSLDELEEKGFTKKNKGRYQVDDEQTIYVKCSGLDLLESQRIVERVTLFPNNLGTKAVSSTSFFIGKEDYQKIKKEYSKTLDKIFLLADKAFKNNGFNSDQKLCLFYSALMTLEPDDSWLDSSSDSK